MSPSDIRHSVISNPGWKAYEDIYPRDNKSAEDFAVSLLSAQDRVDGPRTSFSMERKGLLGSICFPLSASLCTLY
ncbi:hypothetical protein MVEN_01603000 [Mycena venus]|uniref:Uncharacterized protein n=1 Tax=Mycena venus TaxID=2733690 RepID=A0A8H6XSX0_9AGAR|nr:hypothetical protein MVEN_01603000 [Mycena venus]